MSDPVFWRWTLFVTLIKLKTKNNKNKAIPPFFFVYRRMCFLTLGRSVGLKKKNLKKKNHKKSRNSRPWYPRTTSKVNIHIFGWTKSQHTVKNVPVFLYAVTMLNFQIKRIISSEKRLSYVVTFFFLKMPKIWVGRTTVNGERGWPNVQFKRIKTIIVKPGV